jgi:hypothetical protein
VRGCSDKGGLQYGCIVECKAREKAGAATDAATLQHDAADAPLRFPNTEQMGRVMSPTRLLGQPSYDGPQCPRSAASDADIHARRPYVVVGHRRLSAMEGPYLVQTLGSIQDAVCELRRIVLLGSRVNKPLMCLAARL